MGSTIDPQRRPSLTPTPTPEGKGTPTPGGPELPPPQPPRVPLTPTPPQSTARLSLGTTPKVSRAALEQWISSAPSDKNASRHNVYRAILDSGKPSASVMAALCRQVGDEHRVCSEFVAHVLDSRANNRIEEAHCRELLMSMLQAMGPVARHDVDVYVAAATRGFVAREGTREYHSRLREAMMDSLSTLGEAIGLQGNNLNLKSPRWGSKAWDRQNDEKRLLGHLHPDKMRADRAVNARHAIAHTAWQSTGLRDEALKRFAKGLDLGSHRESAHAQSQVSQAAVASASVGASPAPPRQEGPSPTPAQPTQWKYEDQQVQKDTKHSSEPDEQAPPNDSPSELQSPAPKVHPSPAPAPRKIDMERDAAVYIPSALAQWELDVSDFATHDLPEKLRELLYLPELAEQDVHIAVETLTKRIDPLTLIEQWHLMAGIRFGNDAAQVKRIQSALLNSLVVPGLRVEYGVAYVRQAVLAQELHKSPDFTVQTLREFARSLDAARCHDVAIKVLDFLEDRDELQTEFNHAYLAARAARHPDAPAFHGDVSERGAQSESVRRKDPGPGVAYVKLPPEAAQRNGSTGAGAARKDRKSSGAAPQHVAPPQYLQSIGRLPGYPVDPDNSQALDAFQRATASQFNAVADGTNASAFCRGFIAALADHVAQLGIGDAEKMALATAWAQQAFMTLGGMDGLTMADLTELQSALAAQPPSASRDCFERECSLFASLR